MEFKSFDRFDPQLLALIEDLESQVFNESYQAGRFTQEATSKVEPLAIVAFHGEKPVGFKVGYRFKDDIFYSWLGGVIPSWRRKGLGRDMMKNQHQSLVQLGYSKVRTTGRNENREMIILNLQSGFDIIGTHFVSEEKRLSIVMEKNLKN